MKTWYVKEFSKLTQISVRTLHYYDEVGLLKPSFRSSSNYRLYTENDLLKLEQITALKFFGFSIKQIKELISNGHDVTQHLHAQQDLLSKKAAQLQEATDIISTLLEESTSGKPVDWSKLIALIKVYRMENELKKTWMGQSLSPDQIKQFAELKEKFTDKQIKDLEKRWTKLIEKANKHVDEDPASPIAQEIIKEWEALVDEQYADKEELKDAMKLAYKHDKIPNAPFDQKLWTFIGRASRHLHKKKK